MQMTSSPSEPVRSDTGTIAACPRPLPLSPAVAYRLTAEP